MNPRTLDQAVDICRIFGVRTICTFNDHRERMVRIRAVPLDRKQGQARVSSRSRSGST